MGKHLKFWGHPNAKVLCLSMKAFSSPPQTSRHQVTKPPVPRKRHPKRPKNSERKELSFLCVYFTGNGTPALCNLRSLRMEMLFSNTLFPFTKNSNIRNQMWELCRAHSGGTLLDNKALGISGAGAWRHRALVRTWPLTDRREGSQQVSGQDPQLRSDYIHQVSAPSSLFSPLEKNHNLFLLF